MRVLVCGSRDWRDPSFVARHLWHFHGKEPFTLLISGGAAGIDRIANAWAEERGIKTLEIWADWAKHGRAAGPMRNAEMLRLGRPELIIAFPGGIGTGNMVEQARKRGIEIKEIPAP